MFLNTHSFFFIFIAFTPMSDCDWSTMLVFSSSFFSIIEHLQVFLKGFCSHSLSSGFLIREPYIFHLNQLFFFTASILLGSSLQFQMSCLCSQILSQCSTDLVVYYLPPVSQVAILVSLNLPLSSWKQHLIWKLLQRAQLLNLQEILMSVLNLLILNFSNG